MRKRKRRLILSVRRNRHGRPLRGMKSEMQIFSESRIYTPGRALWARNEIRDPRASMNATLHRPHETTKVHSIGEDSLDIIN
jgi:hypothetical protein